MSTNQTEKQIPDKALKLLPWYVTGWLSPEEREYIQDIITQYPEFQELLTTEHEIITTLKEDKSILDQSFLESTDTRLAKVLAQLPSIDNKNMQEEKSVLSPGNGLANSISHFFSNLSNKFQYAMVASITTLVIALSFVFIAPLVERSNESIFYPATSTTLKKGASGNTVLLIGLNTEANNPQLLSLLNNNNAKIDAIPNKNGMYRIYLSVKLNPEQTRNLLNKLTDIKELIWFAGEEF